MLSDYLKNETLGKLNNSYCALFTTNPTGTGATGEVNKVSYSRKLVKFGAISVGQWNNTTDIDFGLATEDWGLITHIGFFDAATGGNFLAYGPLQLAKEVRINEELKIPQNFLIESLV